MDRRLEKRNETAIGLNYLIVTKVEFTTLL